MIFIIFVSLYHFDIQLFKYNKEAKMDVGIIKH